MAGNKKPNRKKMPRGISPFERALNCVKSAEQRVADRNAKVAKEAATAREKAMASHLPPEAIAETFAPVYRILDGIEQTGELEVLTGDIAVFQDPNYQNAWFPMVPSFNGVAEAFSRVSQAHGVEDQGAGLRRLTKKIEVSMPLMVADITAARASLDWMRELATTMTVAEFLQVAKQVDSEAPRDASRTVRVVRASSDAGMEP